MALYSFEIVVYFNFRENCSTNLLFLVLIGFDELKVFRSINKIYE